MNSNIETARTLVALCSKELPDLAEVQRVCGVTFDELLHPTEGWSTVFKDTDTQSSEATKATFTAYHWVENRTKKGLFSIPDDQFDVFNLDQEQCELNCLAQSLKFLHKIQLRKDPRFMDHLRHEFRRWNDSMADKIAPGCKCTKSGCGCE